VGVEVCGWWPWGAVAVMNLSGAETVVRDQIEVDKGDKGRPGQTRVDQSV
jgi:hypothetical protein